MKKKKEKEKISLKCNLQKCVARRELFGERILLRSRIVNATQQKH